MVIYRLFVTEGSTDDYENFIERLNRTGMDWTIEKDLDRADAVIVLAGLYPSRRDYILGLLKEAEDHEKPVIIIRPFGLENVPEELEVRGDEVVGWNPHCIRDAILAALGVEIDEW